MIALGKKLYILYMNETRVRLSIHPIGHVKYRHSYRDFFNFLGFFKFFNI